jgi:hypothetical protein
MKKMMMMAVVAFMATVNANAQFDAGTVSLQPMLGVGVATITNADKYMDGAQMTGAALIGAEFEYQATDKFSLAAGVNYGIQGVGVKDKKMSNVDAKNIRLELGYVKIPVMANYYFAKGWAVKAGVQFGFQTSANVKFRAESGKTTIDYTEDVKSDAYETFDFSIPFGISYQFNKPWVIDARYQLGLTKINKEGDENHKNSVFMITVGYKFAL